MAEKIKKPTLRTVSTDIEKINTLIEKKRTSVVTLQNEIKDLELQLKECIELKDQLTRDGVQQQMNVLFKDKSINLEQLSKIVGVMTQLKDKINFLDGSDIVEAINMIADDKKNINTNTEKKTDEKMVVNTNGDKHSEGNT